MKLFRTFCDIRDKLTKHNPSDKFDLGVIQYIYTAENRYAYTDDKITTAGYSPQPNGHGSVLESADMNWHKFDIWLYRLKG